MPPLRGLVWSTESVKRACDATRVQKLCHRRDEDEDDSEGRPYGPDGHPRFSSRSGFPIFQIAFRRFNRRVDHWVLYGPRQGGARHAAVSVRGPLATCRVTCLRSQGTGSCLADRHLDRALTEPDGASVSLVCCVIWMNGAGVATYPPLRNICEVLFSNKLANAVSRSSRFRLRVCVKCYHKLCCERGSSLIVVKFRGCILLCLHSICYA